MSGKDLGDNLDALIGEVDRHVAPAAGEDGGVGALVRFEEGYYDAEDVVREAADQIRPLVSADLFVAPPLPQPLRLLGEEDGVHGTGRSDRDIGRFGC